MADANGASAEGASVPVLLHKNDIGYSMKGAPWANDALNRESVAHHLTPFIASIRQPFVVSVDAPYGGGKTYFLQNWKRDLDAAGYLTVYFNAWETDYSQDPLLPFMAAVGRRFAQKKAARPGSIDKKTLNTFGRLLAKSGILVVRGLIRQHFGNDVLEGFDKLKETATEDDAMGRIFRQQAENTAAVETFRGELEETIRELTRDLPGERQKLIVFVDELDRCRPDYAVRVLERIKHFFAVRGMVVILGIAEKQVANAMSAVYGAKLDTDGYLRRFIDWRFQLPKPSHTQYAQFLAKRFRWHELKRWKDCKGLHGDPYNSLDVLLNYLGVMSEALELSLRQQEQVFTEVNLYLRTLSAGQSPLSYVVGFLAPLRAGEKEVKDLLDAAFTPQTSELRAKNLFEHLKSKLDEIGGVQRFRHWHEWDDFEGEFLAWFVTRSSLTTIRERCLPGHTNEDEKDMWERCHEHAKFFHKKWGIGDDVSLAQIVRERLDNGGRLLS